MSTRGCLLFGNFRPPVPKVELYLLPFLFGVVRRKFSFDCARRPR